MLQKINLKFWLYADGGEGADESNGSSVGEPLDAKDRVTVPAESIAPMSSLTIAPTGE